MLDHSSNKNSQRINPLIRKKIEASVLKIFSENDFHKINMRAVAKESGVSMGTIYKYYQSKEQLLLSFMDDWLKQATDRMADHLQGIAQIKEKLRKIFWIHLDFYERNIEIGKIILMTVPLKTWMSDETYKQKKMVNLLLGVLRSGQEEGFLDDRVPAEILMDFIIGFVRRIFPMWIYRGQKESLTGQADVIFEMIWRAVSNPEKDRR